MKAPSCVSMPRPCWQLVVGFEKIMITSDKNLMKLFPSFRLHLRRLAVQSSLRTLPLYCAMWKRQANLLLQSCVKCAERTPPRQLGTSIICPFILEQASQWRVCERLERTDANVDATPNKHWIEHNECKSKSMKNGQTDAISWTTSEPCKTKTRLRRCWPRTPPCQQSTEWNEKWCPRSFWP